MSKPDIASFLINLSLFAISIHVALTTWVDHNPVPFGYFYAICICLILNAAYTFTVPSSSK